MGGNFMQKERRIFSVSLVFFVISIIAVYGKAWAQPIDVKITTIQLRHQQGGVGAERLAKYAQERLKDKVRVRTYPAAQLYSGQEEIQAIMKNFIWL